MASPRLIYLHGLASSPRSAKARFLAGRGQAASLTLQCPDLNTGGFIDLTFSRMLDQTRALIRAQPGPVLLLGSSLGGWWPLGAPRGTVKSRVCCCWRPPLSFCKAGSSNCPLRNGPPGSRGSRCGSITMERTSASPLAPCSFKTWPTKWSEGLRPLGGRPTKPGTARPLIRFILAVDVRTAKVLPLQPEFLPGFSCVTWWRRPSSQPGVARCDNLFSELTRPWWEKC